MKRTPPSAAVLALSVLALLVTALTAHLLFDVLAKPRAYKARMASLTVAVDALGQPTGTAARRSYGPRAVCEGAAVPAAQALRKTLEEQAGTVGVTLKGLGVTPSESRSGLAPIEVTFTAEGPYASAVQMLALLQTSQPEVFVDSADLRPTASGASLQIKGRAFCWLSARP